MEDRTGYLIVGSFLVVAITSLVGLMVWFGGGAGQEPVARYLVLFHRDISGLTPGSAVRYLGVDVGQVTSIALAPDKAQTVEVEIEVGRSTPVDAGTFAGLALQGVTGVAFINMDTEPGEHGPINTEPGLRYPVIPSRSVGLAALLADTPAVMGRVNDLLDQAGRLLDESNQASVARTLDNLEELSTALAAKREEIAALPERLEAVLDNLERATDQLPGLVTEVQPEIVAAMQNLNRSSERLLQVTSRLDDWLKENDTEMRSFVGDGLGEIPALVADMRRTVRSLDKLVTELRDDPSQLVHRPQVRAVSVER